MPITRRMIGSLISLTGGLITLIAFFFLPYTTKIDLSNISQPPTNIPATNIQLVTALVPQSAPSVLVAFSLLAIGFSADGMRTHGASSIPLVRKMRWLWIIGGLLVLFSLFSDLAISMSPHVAYHSVLQDTQTYSNGGSASGGGSGNGFAYYTGSGLWLCLLGAVLIFIGYGVLARAEIQLQGNPQTPSAPSSPSTLGPIIAVIGTLLALGAFLWLPYITTAQVAGSDVQLTTATALSLAQSGKSLYWLEGLSAVLLLGGISWYLYRIKATQLSGVSRMPKLLALASMTILLVLLYSYSANSPGIVAHTTILRSAAASTSFSFTCGSGTESFSSVPSGSTPDTVTSTSLIAACTEAAPSVDYGPGFWCYILAMVLVTVGVVVQEATSVRDRVAVSSVEA